MTDKPLRLINGQWMYNPKGWPEKPDRCHDCEGIENRVYFLCERCQDEFNAATKVHESTLRLAIEEAIPVDGYHSSFPPITTNGKVVYDVPEGYKLEIFYYCKNMYNSKVWSPASKEVYDREPTESRHVVARLIHIEKEETRPDFDPFLPCGPDKKKNFNRLIEKIQTPIRDEVGKVVGFKDKNVDPPVSETQEELWKHIVEWIRLWPNISINEVIFHFRDRFSITRKVKP